MTDADGRPVAFELTPGNVAVINVAVPLPETLALLKRLIADEAYNADRLRRWRAERRIVALIPSTVSGPPFEGWRWTARCATTQSG